MQQSDRAGLLYGLAGFCMLAVGDAVVKGMADMWPPTAMAATRYVLAAIGLGAVLVAREGWSSLVNMPRAPLQWARGFAVSLATISMFTALWLMPMAEATAIIFTQPMITVLLATIFLGERPRMGAIIAIVAAFIGVIIVLQPNVAAIGLAALLPLLAAVGMAILMIANRAAAGAAGVLAMQFYISVTASVFLVVATLAGHVTGVPRFTMHWPEWHVLARCAFIAGSATLAHGLIYMGTARAGAATIAPTNNGQLLTAVLLGWLFFGELPDPVALIGAAIIVASGLYLWSIGRRPKAERSVR